MYKCVYTFFIFLLLPHLVSRGKEKLLWVGFELVSTSAGDLNAHTHRRRGSRRDIKTQSISFFSYTLT